MTAFILIPVIFGVLFILLFNKMNRDMAASRANKSKNIETAIYVFRAKLQEAIDSESTDLELWKALTRLHRALSVMVYKEFYVNADLSMSTDINRDAIIWFRKLVLPEQMRDIIDLNLEDVT